LHNYWTYHEYLEEIYRLISKEEDSGKSSKEIISKILSNSRLREVYRCERNQYTALMNYYQVVNRDFDDAVKAMIKFSIYDARKILLRDMLRAKAIINIIHDLNDNNIVIEAGDVHIPLYSYLYKDIRGHKIRPIHLLYKVSIKIGLKPFVRYSVLLTLLHIYNKKLYYLDKLLAARNIIRLLLLKKNEHIPSKDNPYPKLIEEAGINSYISSLSYEECKRLFHRLRVSKMNFSSFRFK